MSNKKTGNDFESWFARTLSKNGFWVHRFQDNKNGQPCDLIAAQDGEAYLFDCKSCGKDFFRLDRVEENQKNAMELFYQTGNRRGMFAIRFPGDWVYLVDYQIMQEIRERGIKRIDQKGIALYGRSLKGWLSDFEILHRNRRRR